MKKCKILLIIEVTLIGFLMPFPARSLGQQNYGENIDLTISLEKEAYLLSEPIWVDVSAKNIGNDNIKILPLVLCNIIF